MFNVDFKLKTDVSLNHRLTRYGLKVLVSGVYSMIANLARICGKTLFRSIKSN